MGTKYITWSMAVKDGIWSYTTILRRFYGKDQKKYGVIVVDGKRCVPVEVYNTDMWQVNKKKL